MAQSQSDDGYRPVVNLGLPFADEQRSRGLVEFRLRRFVEAAILFKRCAEEAPDQAGAHFLQSRASLLSRDYAGARLACQRALDLEPDSFRGHLLMTRIALSSRNQMLAQSHLAKALALRPRSADLHARLAELLAARTQFKKARELAAAACDIDPTCFPARVVIARCQIAMGQLDDAQRLLSELERERPDEPTLAKLRNLLRLRLNANALGRQLESSAPTTADEDFQKTPQLSLQEAAKPEETTVQSIEHGPAGQASLAVSAVDMQSGAPQVGQQVEDDRNDEAPTMWSPQTAWLTPNILDHVFVIRSLIVRDLRSKYRHNPAGIITELMRPTAIVVAHDILFWILRRPMPGNVPIVVFVLGGFSVWFAFNAAEQGAATGAKHASAVVVSKVVSEMHLRFAKALWPFLVNLAFCLVAVVPLNVYGFQLPIPNLIETFSIFCVTGILGFGFGMLFEQLNRIWPAAKIAEKLFIWAIFVSMGLYFSVGHMRPPILARVMLYNPLLHLVECERHAFDPAYPISQVNLIYPATFALSLLFLSLAALKCLPVKE